MIKIFKKQWIINDKVLQGLKHPTIQNETLIFIRENLTIFFLTYIFHSFLFMLIAFAFCLRFWSFSMLRFLWFYFGLWIAGWNSRAAHAASINNIIRSSDVRRLEQKIFDLNEEFLKKIWESVILIVKNFGYKKSPW